MRRVALAAAVLVPVLVPTTPGHAAGPCAVTFEQRNSWHRVATPGPVVMRDADSCRLLATHDTTVETSEDGGLSWQRGGEAPAEVTRLVASGVRGAYALTKGGALWHTADWGAHWQQAKGPTDPVRDVVVDPKRSTHLLALTRPALPTPGLPATLPVDPATDVWESFDDGASFTARQDTTGLAVTSAAIDPGVAVRFWIGVGGPAGGLFVGGDSAVGADSPALTRVAGGDVTDVVSVAIPGGGSEAIATTSDGVLVSRDASTALLTLKGTAFTGLAMEADHPSAGLLLAGSVRRTSDTAATVRAQSAGLPDDCAPSFLRRDRSVPSVFLVDCADGSTWRYRSDGTDLSTIDNANGTAGTLPNTGLLVPTPMKEIARRAIPIVGARVDGSVAFDGSVLYYTDTRVKGVVHRMLATTGKGLPDIKTTIHHGIGHVAYDANRHQLIALDGHFVVWTIDLRTSKAVKLFQSPLNGQAPRDGDPNESFFWGSMSFDSATDRILFAGDGADGFDEYDRTGQLTHSCPHLNLPATISVGMSGTNNVRASIAALVATGDGLVYVEAEDDASVVRIDRACHVLAEFDHDVFSESPNENDAIACDTTSFAVPAIWMRDAEAGLMIAYSVDKGYCALPSTISVTAPPSVATGGAGRVCAHLRSRAKGVPLPGLPVDLLVAGRGIGSPKTDAHGIACTDYVPLASEAGTGTGTSKASQPVLAAFLGTPAYRPADARASLEVTRSVLPLPVPALGEPAAAAVLAAPPPPPPIQPPQPPPPAPQNQPVTQPQGHPGAQPGAMGQLGAATMPEDEPEAQAQGADTHNMVGIDPGVYLPGAFGVLAFWLVQRRRWASRVKGQRA